MIQTSIDQIKEQDKDKVSMNINFSNKLKHKFSHLDPKALNIRT